MHKKFPQVYFDISIGAKPGNHLKNKLLNKFPFFFKKKHHINKILAGKVVFELFTDLTPKTAENFRGLCTGCNHIKRL